MPNQKIADDSQDKKYFILTPQIVWAMCDSPYEFTLWIVIKMIAAEKGECYLSTEDLASLAMMSTGKVSECRKSLFDKKLICGNLYKDPSYPQPVWHLRIPDLWADNVKWRQENDSLKGRVNLKIEQKKSLHVVKPSRGEEGTSPREEGTSPRETKKNHKNNRKEETIESPSGDPAPSPTQIEQIEKPTSNGNSFVPPQTLTAQQELEEFGLGSYRSAPLPIRQPITELELLAGSRTPVPTEQDRPLIERAEADLMRSGWDIKTPAMRFALVYFLAYTPFEIPQSDSTRRGWLKALKDHLEEYGHNTLPWLYQHATQKLYEKRDKPDFATPTGPWGYTKTMAGIRAIERVDGPVAPVVESRDWEPPTVMDEGFNADMLFSGKRK